MAMHNSQLPNREAVARITDPDAWLIHDRWQAKGETRAASSRVAESLARADAILALIPSPDQGEACCEALRTFAVQMEYDCPGDVPEECGMWCDLCKQHVDDDKIGGHAPECLLATPPVDSAKPGEAALDCWTCRGRTFAEITHSSNSYSGTLHRCVNCKAIYPDFALSASLPEPQLGVGRMQQEAIEQALADMGDGHNVCEATKRELLSALTATSKGGV